MNQKVMGLLAQINGRLSVGVPVYAAFTYVSTTKHPRVPPTYEAARRVVLSLKAGDAAAARAVAKRLIAENPKLRRFRGVIVPAPRSTIARLPHTHLAQALHNLGVGTQVATLVKRTRDVPSSRMLRRRGEPGLTSEQHEETLRAQEGYKNLPVLIVDDVFTTGATLRATIQVLKRAGYRGPFSAAVAAYAIESPNEAPALSPMEQTL